MKDTSTHVAHKTEHALALETGAIISVIAPGVDEGETTTLTDTAEAVPDEGYHWNAVFRKLSESGVRR